MVNSKHYLFISLILFLSVGIFSINAIVDKSLSWHPETQVFIKVGENEMTLQQALDGNILDGPSTYTHSYDTATISGHGHSANRIWASVNGNEDILLNLLSVENGLCGSTTITQYVGSNIPNPVQFADEIEISPEKSLQDAIDLGDFCCDSTYLDSCNSDSCTDAGTISCDGTVCEGWDYKPSGTSCGTNMECNDVGGCGCMSGYTDCAGSCDCNTKSNYCIDSVCRTCDKDYLEDCGGGVDGDIDCWPEGTINCDGDCTETYIDKGTSCGSDDLEACDGVGNCVIGYTGTGCSLCPAGTSSGTCSLSGALSGYQGRYYYEASLFEESLGIGSYWTAWSYTTAPTCSRAVCCGWQIFCWTPRCSKDVTWEIKH